MTTKAASVATEIGARATLAVALDTLGWLACDRDDPSAARAMFATALRLRRDVGHRHLEAGHMIGLAHVASTTGDHHRAARLCGAAMASSDTSHIPLEPIVAGRLGQIIDCLRLCLDDAGLNAELEDGRTHTQQVTLRALADAIDDPAGLADAVAPDLANVAAE